MVVDQTIQPTENLNASLPATSTFPFDNNTFTSLDWSFSDIFPAQPTAPSAAPLLETPQLLQRGRYIRSQNPWNAHDAHGNVFNENPNTGCVTYETEPSPIHSYDPERSPLHPYEPERSPLPYETSSPIENTGLSLPDQGPLSNDLYGSELPRHNWFDESDASTSYSNTLYTPSHGSPASHHSPRPQGSLPPPSPNDAGNHSHVFSAYAEPQKNKVTRGRVRPLTDKEKREARDVRQAGACWACHLSKIKVCIKLCCSHAYGYIAYCFASSAHPVLRGFLVNSVLDFLGREGFVFYHVSMIQSNRWTNFWYLVCLP